MARHIPELHLEYPEWEKQKDEKNEHKEAFDCYVAHGGSIRQCAKDLQGYQRGTIFHGIKLKYNPYSEVYYRQLAVANKFEHRRNLKDAYDLEIRNHQFDKIENETAIDDFTITHETQGDMLRLLSKWVQSGQKNGTQSKDLVAAINGLSDYKDKIRRKEDTKKLVINGELDAKHAVKTDLRTDLEKVQDQILSPAFAEVTRNLSTHLKEDSK